MGDYLEKKLSFRAKKGKMFKKKEFSVKKGCIVKHLKNSENGYKWFKMAKKC